MRDEIPLAPCCTAAQILRLAAIAEERRSEAGETIYEVHDPAGSLHCVVDGTVKLDDPPHQVVVETGGAFGVSDLLARRLRHATATAETDTLILTIEADDFLRVWLVDHTRECGLPIGRRWRLP